MANVVQTWLLFPSFRCFGSSALSIFYNEEVRLMLRKLHKNPSKAAESNREGWRLFFLDSTFSCFCFIFPSHSQLLITWAQDKGPSAAPKPNPTEGQANSSRDNRPPTTPSSEAQAPPAGIPLVPLPAPPSELQPLPPLPPQLRSFIQGKIFALYAPLSWCVDLILLGRTQGCQVHLPRFSSVVSATD